MFRELNLKYFFKNSIFTNDLPLNFGVLNIHELLLIHEIREICTPKKNTAIRYFT